MTMINQWGSSQDVRKRITEPPQGAEARDSNENTLKAPDNSQNVASHYSAYKVIKEITKLQILYWS